MAREFKHMLVTFTRKVVELQTIDVAVDAALSEETAEQMARELAVGRLKATGWKAAQHSEYELTNCEAAE